MPVAIGKNEKLKSTVTCSHCGTIYEYWPNEVYNLWNGKDYGGGSAGTDGFKCTSGCGKDVIVRSW